MERNGEEDDACGSGTRLGLYVALLQTLGPILPTLLAFECQSASSNFLTDSFFMWLVSSETSHPILPQQYCMDFVLLSDFEKL